MSWHKFIAAFEAGAKILEIGTKRHGGGPSHVRHLFPKCEYVLSDMEEGEDVEVVVDCHKLGEKWQNEYDGIIARSVFEHLENPFVAARAIETALKPGGRFFVQTHQTFPIHGYPQDYFRFTDKALLSLFNWAHENETEYEFPCKIEPPPGVRWNKFAASYLNVCIDGKKPV